MHYFVSRTQAFLGVIMLAMVGTLLGAVPGQAMPPNAGTATPTPGSGSPSTGGSPAQFSTSQASDVLPDDILEEIFFASTSYALHTIPCSNIAPPTPVVPIITKLPIKRPGITSILKPITKVKPVKVISPASKVIVPKVGQVTVKPIIKVAPANPGNAVAVEYKVLNTDLTFSFRDRFHAPTSLLGCGWQAGERVEITLVFPDGRSFSITQTATEQGVPLTYNYTRNDPPGPYQFIFKGQTGGEAQYTTEFQVPTGPHVFIEEDGIFLFGFQPNERLRLFEFCDAMRWQPFVVDGLGRLLVATDRDRLRCAYAALGEVSGEVRTSRIVESIVKPTVQATPLPSLAAMTAPADGAVLSGDVDVRGSASMPAFGYYKFELEDPRCAKGVCFVANFTQPVFASGGLLMRWNTRTIPNGTYIVRLVVVDKNGLVLPQVPRIRITIQN